jgi:hypothetical protein
MTCATHPNPARPKATKRQRDATPTAIRKRLEGKLLSLGGSCVLWQGDGARATFIAARGRPFTLPVRMRRGEPHRCHGNAADLWARGTEKCQLVTGYALAGDAWLSHSWVVGSDNLYETTRRFERYFGAPLEPLLASMFWVDNFFVDCLRRGGLPPGFWQERPGLCDVMGAAGLLPRDELERRMTAQSHGRTA